MQMTSSARVGVIVCIPRFLPTLPADEQCQNHESLESSLANNMCASRRRRLIIQ